MSVILMFDHFVVRVSMARIQNAADTDTDAKQDQQTAERDFLQKDCSSDTEDSAKDQPSDSVKNFLDILQ